MSRPRAVYRFSAARRRNCSFLVGILLYPVGTVGVTMVFNVPLNDALAGSRSAEDWHSYVKAWLGWNHVRALLTFAAAVSLTSAASQVHRLAR